MCGICGFVSNSSNRWSESEKTSLIKDMIGAIKHRGPDHDGFFTDDLTTLGMCRLSILDLSGGNQPLFSENGKIVLVCNGEIYNFRELREELRKKGHEFVTGTDVECIIHLYEEAGEGFLDSISGMFALALWDSEKKRLILARDRLGIKPLYYFEGFDGRIAIGFASEIKSILKIPDFPRDMDFQVLYDYLSYNYIVGSATIFKRIRKLPPGFMMVWEKGKTVSSRYWDLNLNCSFENAGEMEIAGNVSDIFGKAVESHLQSDVPVGVFLSGGLDSSAITAIIKKKGRSVKTFSIGFDEKSFNELPEAEETARLLGTEHYSDIARPSPDTILEMAGFFDEPFGDSSALPVFMVSRLARNHVKVVLSGEGGDEIFAGYMTYEADMLAEKFNRLPRFIRKGLLPALVNLLPVSTRKVSFDYKARRFLKGADKNLLSRHYDWKVILDTGEKEKILSPSVIADIVEKESERIMHGYFSEGKDSADSLNRILFSDVKTYLPDDLLVKVDRMSMAHSLEARVPFLDGEMVEYAFSIPSSLKLKGRVKKYIFKKALSGLLPDRIIHRKKAGFSIPAGKWLKGELKSFAREVLSPTAVKKTGIFNVTAVEELWRCHQEGRAELSRQIWGLLMFMLWHRNYLS